MKKATWSAILMVAVLSFAGVATAEGAQQPPRKAQKRVAAVFKKLDANQDRAISRDEWKRRPKAFDRLDADHNGVLSVQELARGVRKARKR